MSQHKPKQTKQPSVKGGLSESVKDRIGHQVSAEDPNSHFELLNLLGKGAFGFVYRATDKRTKQEVAIKIVSLVEDAAIQDVRQEIGMLKEFKNSHIIQYFGSYFEHENLWIIMEYCEGGSIGEILRATDKPLNEEQIALICSETLKGLQYVHSKRKIHRDVKGGNILLTADGDVKLADFGVSAALESTFSKRNTFAGTPYWMAPEVILENAYDGRADIWSVGITAIEMAELNPPHAEVHPWRVLFKIPKDPPPQLHDRRSWTTLFHDFVGLCLRKNPNRRPTAEKLLRHAFLSSPSPKVILLRLLDEAKRLKQHGGTAGDNDLQMDTFVHQTTKSAYVDDTARSSATPRASGTEGEPSYTSTQVNELRRIRQTSTIQLPWISLHSISPITLLSPVEEADIVSALAELTMNQLPDISALNFDTYTRNLIKTYSYNRHKQLNVPMNEAQREVTNRIVNDLSVTLKTILRI